MLSWKVIRQYGHFIIFCLKSKHFSWKSYSNWKYLLIHLNLRNYKACIEIYISGELWFLWQSLGNGGLNENRPHWHRHLYTWFLVDGAVWRLWRGAASLKEVCHQGQGLEFKALHHFRLDLHFQLTNKDVISQLLHLLPCLSLWALSSYSCCHIHPLLPCFWTTVICSPPSGTVKVNSLL